MKTNPIIHVGTWDFTSWLQTITLTSMTEPRPDEHGKQPPELEPADILLLAEEANGKPLPMRSVQGMTQMSQRLTMLKRQLAETIAHAKQFPCPQADDIIAKMRQQIMEAETRYHEYELMNKGAN